MFDVKETDLFNLDDDAFGTVIESDIVFTGSIRFAKPLVIRGTVKGSIDATSDLVVDAGAQVEADIKADRILVKGKVKGNVAAKKIVFVTATGSLDGDITAAQVALEPGSAFSGKCTMTN